MESSAGGPTAAAAHRRSGKAGSEIPPTDALCQFCRPTPIVEPLVIIEAVAGIGRHASLAQSFPNDNKIVDTARFLELQLLRNDLGPIDCAYEYDLHVWLRGQQISIESAPVEVVEPSVRSIRKAGSDIGARQRFAAPPRARAVISNQLGVTAETMRDRARAAYLAMAAAEICNGVPPPDFMDALAIFANQIAWEIKRESEYPPRKEQRKALKRVVKAAKFLRKYATAEEFVCLALSDVIARARAAENAIPREKGRAKFHPQSTIGNPKDLCALVVQVAWHLWRGKWPNDVEPSAIRACDFLCAAAGDDIERQYPATVQRKENALGTRVDLIKAGYTKKEIEEQFDDCKKDNPEHSIWARNHMRIARERRGTWNADAIRDIFVRIPWRTKGKMIPAVLAPSQQLRREEILLQARSRPEGHKWYRIEASSDTALMPSEVEAIE
jgi:hypothetical protein